MTPTLKRLAKRALQRAMSSPLAPLLEEVVLWGSRGSSHRRPWVAAAQAVRQEILRRDPTAVRRVRIAGGGVLVCPLHEWAASHIYLFNEYEPDTTALVQRILRPGDVVFDVGANIGYYAILAAGLMGATGRVFAFEANPELCELLRRAAREGGMADRVRVIEAAVSNREAETAILRLSADRHSSGVSSILELEGLTGEGAFAVPTTTLDSQWIAASRPQVRLLKIDIEGAELMALEGATALLAARPSFIVCETQPNSKDPLAHLKLVERFRQLGYLPNQIGAAGRLIELSEVAHVVGAAGVNLCFAPKP